MPLSCESCAAYRRVFGRLAALVLWCAVLFLLGAAILPSAAALPWPSGVRAWLSVIENLRLPIGLAAFVVVITSLILRRGRLVVAASFAVALSGLPVLANIQGSPPIAASVPMLKVVAFNVWTLNRQTDRIMAYLRQEKPDIVFLEEVREPHKHAFAALKDLYPTQITCHGNTIDCETMVLTRFPVRAQQAGRINGALPSTAAATLDVDGRNLIVMAVHVVWPFPFRSQDAQREQVMHLAASLSAFDGPLLIGGDFNGGGWVRNQRDLRAETGLVNEPGFHPTWPALPIHGLDVPEWLRLPIDHVLSRNGPMVIAAEAGPELGSDHLPLVATIAWPAGETAPAQ